MALRTLIDEAMDAEGAAAKESKLATSGTGGGGGEHAAALAAHIKAVTYDYVKPLHRDGGHVEESHGRGDEADEHEHENETDRACERDAHDCGRSAGDATHSGYDLSCTGSAGDNDTNDTDDWPNATNHRTLWRGREWSRPEEEERTRTRWADPSG